MKLRAGWEMFETEMDFFVSHQDELVSAHRGMVLVIRGREVLGAHSSPLEAYLAANARYEPGSYMIQPCLPGPGAYTVTLSLSMAL